jgi:hypothetical protein
VIIVTPQTKAFGLDRSVAVISFVVNPIKTCTMSQRAQTTVAARLDGPGRQVDGTALEMQRVLAAFF